MNKTSDLIPEKHIIKDFIIDKIESEVDLKKAKTSTGGYSELYGAGYSTNKDTVQEIRNASNNMGETLKKIAKEIHLPTTQTKGHFNFGAGVQINGKDFLFKAPSAFVEKTNYLGRESIIFSADCVEDYKKSPVIIEIIRLNMPKNCTAEELKAKQRAGAKSTGREFKEILLDEHIASVMTEHRKNMAVISRISIVREDKKELINLIITVNEKIENFDEISKRIYLSFYFTDVNRDFKNDVRVYNGNKNVEQSKKNIYKTIENSVIKEDNTQKNVKQIEKAINQDELQSVEILVQPQKVDKTYKEKATHIITNKTISQENIKTETKEKEIAKEIIKEKIEPKINYDFSSFTQINGEDYVFKAPPIFTVLSNHFGREKIAFCREFSNDYRKSPVIIEVTRTKLPEYLTLEQIKSRQKAGAKLTDREYKDLIINERIACITIENKENAPVINRVSIIKKDKKEMLNLTIIIDKNIKNHDEITKKIYFSFYFTEYGKYKN